MIDDHDRRGLMRLALAALPTLLTLGPASHTEAGGVETRAAGLGPQHDFDYFVGDWTVHHRVLRKRLAGATDWDEFHGTTRCQSLLGGLVNLNESVSNRPSGVTRGLGLRAYDAKTAAWADWYLDTRTANVIDPPGVGRFAKGVGTFLSDDTFEGRPIKVRGRFSSLSPREAQWDQAFSTDGGQTWEVNWVMRYSRVGPDVPPS
jgi:hypothetical protein